MTRQLAVHLAVTMICRAGPGDHYLGAMISVACITVVSLVTFDTVGHALLPPAIYVAVNMADNFISPLFVGKRMVLNPLVVFLALMFWGWIWGSWACYWPCRSPWRSKLFTIISRPWENYWQQSLPANNASDAQSRFREELSQIRNACSDGASELRGIRSIRVLACSLQ